MRLAKVSSRPRFPPFTRALGLALLALGLTLGLSSSLACGTAIAPEGGSASDAGSSDAGDAGPSDAGDAGLADGGDAGTNPDAGLAISAPADTWTWIDFPDSKCASGSATGIAINPHAGATDVVIYFEGGGACGTADTCWGASPSAENLSGYDATTFAAAKQVNYPTLSRANAANPYRALNFVYVPYCTGDLHAGRTIAGFTVNGAAKPTYFWGAIDLDSFLARIVPTFPQAQRVYAIGTSAGGFATYLDFAQIASAFGGIRVDMLDDSGPPLVAKGATDNAAALSAWGYVAPANCTAPCNKFSDVLAAARSSQPASQFGFLTFAEDTTISARYGYTVAEYPAVMAAFSQSLAGDANAATYTVTNEESHVVQSDLALSPDYLPWIALMFNGGAGWADVTFANP